MDEEGLIWKRVKEKGTLIAAHRGTHGGNIIQNTCEAYKNSLLHGADCIEVDIIASNDNVLYAFHDGMEKTLFQNEMDLRNLSSKKIDSLYYYNSIGEITKKTPERFERILDEFQDKCLINIDRGWPYFQLLFDFLNERGSLENLLIKSPPKNEYLELFINKLPQVMYMPIIKTPEELDRVLSNRKINLAAVELVFDSINSEVVHTDLINKLHNGGIPIWVNSISLNDDMLLSGPYSDNAAIIANPWEVYRRLIVMGFDIIQTDWPALLNKVLNEGLK